MLRSELGEGGKSLPLLQTPDVSRRTKVNRKLFHTFFSVDNYKSFSALDGFSVSNVRESSPLTNGGPWETIRRLGFMPSSRGGESIMKMENAPFPFEE